MAGRGARVSSFAGGLAHAKDSPSLEQAMAGLTESELELRLGEAGARARAAWPGLGLDDERFAFWLGARCAGPALAWLASIHSDDLYLASACIDRVHGAAEALQRAFRSEVRAAVRSVFKDASQVDEVEQSVFTKILVPSEEQQGLRGYTGKGTLKSWLKVAAVRTALHAVEKRQHEIALATGAMQALRESGDDAEVALARQTHGKAFREALDVALASLGTRERDVLKASYVENATVDVIAERFSVHRATAARWVVAAERTFGERLRAALRERLAVADHELESIMRQVDGDVANTLRRHLAAIP